MGSLERHISLYAWHVLLPKVIFNYFNSHNSSLVGIQVLAQQLIKKHKLYKTPWPNCQQLRSISLSVVHY